MSEEDLDIPIIRPYERQPRDFRQKPRAIGPAVAAVGIVAGGALGYAGSKVIHYAEKLRTEQQEKVNRLNAVNPETGAMEPDPMREMIAKEEAKLRAARVKQSAGGRQMP